MAKIEFKGLEEYQSKLIRLSKRLDEQVMGAAIKGGAAVVMDAVKEHLNAVPTDDSHGPDRKIGPGKSEKEAVVNAYGIAPLQMDDRGFLNVKIGTEADYYGPPTKSYPKGRPVLMIVRSIISGTSFMDAHPFVKTAVRQSRKSAVETMAKKVDEEIDKIMKG